MTDEQGETTFDDALVAGLVRAAGAWAIATGTDLPEGTAQAVLVQCSPAIGRLLVIEPDGIPQEVHRGPAGEELATLVGSVGATALKRVRDSGQEGTAAEAVRLMDAGVADLCVLIQRFPNTARVLIMRRDGSIADAVELGRLVDNS